MNKADTDLIIAKYYDRVWEAVRLELSGEVRTLVDAMKPDDRRIFVWLQLKKGNISWS